MKLMRESTSPFTAPKYNVILIQEGLGNLKDCFYYTREALEKAAQSRLFEGAQCFANHPDAIEEQARPERSVKDLLGYFQDVKFEENDGVGALTGTLVPMQSMSLDWSLALLTNSLDYAKKFKETDFVGLSINASGEASAVPIEEFTKSETLPKGILPKLMQAVAKGITEVKVVTELKEAVSCDLVTRAGAGGRILKMLEQERTAMKKKETHEKHAEKNQHEDEAMEKKMHQADGDAGAPAAHDDEDQDKALFAKMIKQYLGKDEPSQEEMEMAKHAHEACKEMGMEGEEAYEGAGKHLKMALAIGKKMAQKQTEDEAKEAAPAPEHKDADADADEEKAPKKKESAAVMQLSAQVAKLQESVKKYEMRDYLDEKLKSSGLSVSVTKKFREALGAPKSKEHIDSGFKMFKSIFDAAKSEVAEDNSVGFVFTEKNVAPVSSTEGKLASFEDCAG